MNQPSSSALKAARKSGAEGFLTYIKEAHRLQQFVRSPKKIGEIPFVQNSIKQSIAFKLKQLQDCSNEFLVVSLSKGGVRACQLRCTDEYGLLLIAKKRNKEKRFWLFNAKLSGSQQSPGFKKLGCKSEYTQELWRNRSFALLPSGGSGCTTTVHKGGLHLLATSDEQFQVWYSALCTFMVLHKTLPYVLYTVRRACIESGFGVDDQFSFRDVSKIFSSQRWKDASTLEDTYSDLMLQTDQHITYEQLLLLFTHFLESAELKAVFNNYAVRNLSTGEHHMTSAGLSSFLREEQSVEVCVEECEAIIREIRERSFFETRPVFLFENEQPRLRATSPLPADVDTWTSGQVLTWLEGELNLGKFSGNFVNTDGSALATLMPVAFTSRFKESEDAGVDLASAQRAWNDLWVQLQSPRHNKGTATESTRGEREEE